MIRTMLLVIFVVCSLHAATLMAQAPGGQYRIVATVGMIGDVVSQVAGDRAEVGVLMGAGIDPHLYSPTRSDIRRLMQADVIFSNGLLLEGKLTDALQRAAASGKPVHALAEAIESERKLAPEEYEGQFDPHLWMDPSLWMSVTEQIRDRLIEFDPSGEQVYRENANAYLAKLAELDKYARQVLGSVPERQRVLVTAHDAFNYFGRRYGYEVVAIQGLSTESEAGVRDIERLVNLLVDRQIKAVFVESTVSERNIRALTAGARARGHLVVIGGSLFSDAMGPAGHYEGTYIGMIDHNVTTIARALGGEAPMRGMHGSLKE